MKKEIELITKTAVKERGWTDGAIKKFLKNPDQTKVNPHYKCAAPTCLYSIGRVESIEESDDFQVWKSKYISKKKSAKIAVETKKKKLLDYVKTLDIELANMPLHRVKECAIDHYNELNSIRGTGKFACENDDSDFLRRIMLNYLRHQCSNYEYELYRIYGKTGVSDAYALLKEKVFNKIYEQYPSLKAE